MERTKPHEVSTSPFEHDEVAHYIYDVGSVEYALHCGTVNLSHIIHKDTSFPRITQTSAALAPRGHENPPRGTGHAGEMLLWAGGVIRTLPC